MSQEKNGNCEIVLVFHQGIFPRVPPNWLHNYLVGESGRKINY